MPAYGIIPARYGSTRFPGKPLADIGGRSMIHCVYERAARAKRLEEVLVATDDKRIYDAVLAFGGDAVMTKGDHATGTDRLAEVARQLPGVRIIVNIQGDEPLIAPEAIDAVVAELENNRDLVMCSVMTPLTSAAAMRNPNVVKVITDADNYAIYFTRLFDPMPSDKYFIPGPWKRHIGLYAYRRDFLLKLTEWPSAPLEQSERLEQLRVLEHGYRIKMVERKEDFSIGVDTPEDLARVNAVLAQAAARK